MQTRYKHFALTGLLVLALLPRAAALWVFSDNLSDDRDAYLGIARTLAEGNGFSAPGTTAPTAFRPPLYPLLLAGVFRLGGGDAALGLLHLVLGTVTVLLTFQAGRQLGLRQGAWVAAVLVAVDPLLVQYATFPMTETLFTFLAALLLVIATREPGGPGHWRQAALGGVFGLCALCRPTIWVFGLLAGIWWVWKTIGIERKGIGGLAVALPWPAVLAVVVVVSPWLVRNIVVLGHPVLTTTHGGYTLLLGNNPVFYREVVDQPWGTVWDGESLADWQKSLEVQMKREEPPVVGEVNRDRWMYGRALEHIAEAPGTFVRACWLRFRRFWNIVPMGAADEALLRPLRWGIGLYYSLLIAGVVLGLARLKRMEWPRWMPLVLLLVALTLVHIFFWSNMRMRAPLTPVMALLAVRGGDLRSKQVRSAH